MFQYYWLHDLFANFVCATSLPYSFILIYFCWSNWLLKLLLYMIAKYMYSNNQMFSFIAWLMKISTSLTFAINNGSSNWTLTSPLAWFWGWGWTTSSGSWMLLWSGGAGSGWFNCSSGWCTALCGSYSKRRRRFGGCYSCSSSPLLRLRFGLRRIWFAAHRGRLGILYYNFLTKHCFQ